MLASLTQPVTCNDLLSLNIKTFAPTDRVCVCAPVQTMCNAQCSVRGQLRSNACQVCLGVRFYPTAERVRSFTELFRVPPVLEFLRADRRARCDVHTRVFLQLSEPAKDTPRELRIRSE